MAWSNPDDRERYWSSQMAALDENRDWHWQGRILTRQGELRWADIKASARCFEDGRAVWDGVVWDITANKQIELELGESRAQLASCRRTWSRCGRRRRRVSPARSMMSWARC
ncbi:PAS domain-containing protein [Pseudomonas aeruginosa]|uniref:PAS domain-containing protein n=1 Tax=Pseudomonas aeruginosa TaxID=287 RepID=UPI003D26726B